MELEKVVIVESTDIIKGHVLMCMGTSAFITPCNYVTVYPSR